MSTIVTALVGPNSYNLTDGAISWRILDENLAMAPIRRLKERGPLQHGATDLGFRLDPRPFVLTLKTQGTSQADLRNRRKTLINIFKPLASIPIKLRYDLDNGDVRQIDCYVAGGGLQMNERDREGFLQTAIVNLEAADPTFYDPTLQTVSFGLSAAAFTVPMVIPLNVGSNNINQSRAVTYAGTWPVNPVIQVVGPITNPIILNQTTGEKISFFGIFPRIGDHLYD
jgi:hypothetical protein